MSSLLAHLYSRIKGSQEDVATLSLHYILSQSQKLNQEFTRLLSKALNTNIDTSLSYVCQATGKNLERPDIAGIDTKGAEHVLCEAKFYAGLTDNQPIGYIERLKKENGIGLVFICPEARKISLWSKILGLCSELSVSDIDDYCVEVDGVRLALVSWNQIIESLSHVASTEATSALPDIYQLDGFCKLMDQEAFVPFTQDDFGPENAILGERYYRVLDTVFDQLKTDKSLRASSKGLKATAYRSGYVRYIKVLDYALSVNYDRNLWRNTETEETPFWVSIMDPDFRPIDSIRAIFSRYPETWKADFNNTIALPLFAPTNVPLDDVAQELKRQIIDYIQVIIDS